MNKKKATELLMKARQLAEVAGEACGRDENYFAKGMADDRWVAWIMMIPGHEVIVYDVTKSDPTGTAIEELTATTLDRLLKLTWTAAKPIGALDAMARAAATEERNSGPGDVTVYDGTGKGITDAPKDRPKAGAQHLEDLTDVDERSA